MPTNQPNQLTETIIVDDNERVVIDETVIAPIGEPAVNLVGEDARLRVRRSGAVAAPDDGNTAVVVNGDNDRIRNAGEISGSLNGISSVGNELDLINTGIISSDSRAIDLSDGDGISVKNSGQVIGTDDQRNGTIYVDGTVDDLRLVNTANGVVDAGEGNLGDAISVQVGAAGDPSSDDINIINAGLLQGRGDGPEVFAGGRVAANGSSGLRFFNGSGEPEATVSGLVRNTGTITSEVSVGFLGGVVIEDGVAFDGRIVNGRNGTIFGPNNGLYVGNADHDLDIINRGLIQSDSRAVNVDGDNVTVINSGDILGTGNQRNGTLYVDGTADDITISNLASGVVDAGEGNLGDAISVQVGAVGDPISNNIDIFNDGLLQGRGDGPEVFAGGRVAANGSSGLRFFNGSGEPEATVTGLVRNRGTITSEVSVGFLGGVVVEDGVAFDGRIVNGRSGNIFGPNNGLYIGNANHDLDIINRGLIESDSRAVNLDGDNVLLRNSGDILGTGNQRNGTIYLDGTADDITIENLFSGVVDAGEGNLGDAISVQVGASGDPSSESINIFNDGLLQGRGDGPAVFAGGRVAGNGSSGLRFFNGSGEPEATVTGFVRNTGTITSEVSVGFLGGVVIEDGVAFDGRIVNGRTGNIFGPNNGLYVGNANHDLDIINRGLIESGSRAVNLDGDNVTLINRGDILGTGDQRNGTVYVDGTGDDIDIRNVSGGVIDAGEGNSGSGVSVQVGVSGDVLSDNIDIVNGGIIQGRGTDNVPAGIRLFVGAGLDEAIFRGSIVNRTRGVIDSEDSAGILIEEGVLFDGTITNRGLISGGNGISIDARGARDSVDVTNTGTSDGDVLLGDFDDVLDSSNGEVDGAIFGFAGDDRLIGGSESDVLVGGKGDDTLTGGSSRTLDTFVFSPVALGADIITDFQDGLDLLDVSAFNFGSAGIRAVIGGARQIGGDTLLTFAPQNTVLLENVQATALDSTDFITQLI